MCGCTVYFRYARLEERIFQKVQRKFSDLVKFYELLMPNPVGTLLILANDQMIAALDQLEVF